MANSSKGKSTTQSPPQHTSTTKSKHPNPRRRETRKVHQAVATSSDSSSSSSSSSNLHARVGAVLHDDKSTKTDKQKAAVEKLMSLFRGIPN